LGMLIRLRRIYNFLLFHANIIQLSYTSGNFLYYFLGTNILIQCPVPVPICCMFFVSRKIHIKWSPNGIKTDGDFFGIYVIFGKKNQRETMLEGATRQGALPGPSWPPHKAVGALLSLQESQYPDRNRVKISAQSELRISGNIRNGERPESGTQKQRETKRQIQSRRGTRPSAAMEAIDQRGNPSPI